MPSVPHDLEAEVHALPSSESGRKTPFLSGYRACHDFGKVGHLNDGMHEYPEHDRIDLGTRGRALIWLLAADENFGLLSVGDSFTVQDGNRIVGQGKITAIRNALLQKTG